MFNHPSTACNEQNLNSVIVKPAQGTKLDVVDVLEKDTYRVEGYAYDGGGHEVQRVELSLDGGKTWLYCLRHVRHRQQLPVTRGLTKGSSRIGQFGMARNSGPGSIGILTSMRHTSCAPKVSPYAASMCSRTRSRRREFGISWVSELINAEEVIFA